MNFKFENILVTEGLGFIGTNFLEEMLNKDFLLRDLTI